MSSSRTLGRVKICAGCGEMIGLLATTRIPRVATRPPGTKNRWTRLQETHDLDACEAKAVAKFYTSTGEEREPDVDKSESAT